MCRQSSLDRCRLQSPSDYLYTSRLGSLLRYFFLQVMAPPRTVHRSSIWRYRFRSATRRGRCNTTVTLNHHKSVLATCANQHLQLSRQYLGENHDTLIFVNGTRCRKQTRMGSPVPMERQTRHHVIVPQQNYRVSCFNSSSPRCYN